MNKARVESFSDGVFAFAITLLVLGFQVPDLKIANDAELRRSLLAQLPQVIPYVTSFVTIGVIWMNHHNMFHDVDHVERGTLILNLLVLLVVSFIPYPTAVLGRYGSVRSAAVFYGLVLTLLGISYTILWCHLVRRKLSKVAEDNRKQRARTLRNLVGAFGYPAATAIAFVSPRTAVLLYFALALFYFSPEQLFNRSKEPERQALQ